MPADESLALTRKLQRLYDATEMFGTLAILSGMLGTCIGLLDGFARARRLPAQQPQR